MFRVVLKPSASKELAALPRHIQVRFARVVHELESDPFRCRSKLDVLRMQGAPARYRLRLGDHRGIFEVEGDVVRFLRFGHRSTVYR